MGRDKTGNVPSELQVSQVSVLHRLILQNVASCKYCSILSCTTDDFILFPLYRDFSNVFKAFIGSNYLGMPYAFAQAGIVAGLFGLVLIAGESKGLI